MLIFRIMLVAWCAWIGLAATGASADDDDGRCKRDQDCALDAVKNSEIRSFADVLAVVRRQVHGQIVSVELKREDDAWVYNIKVLGDDGRRQKVEVDARTLDILKLKAD